MKEGSQNNLSWNEQKVRTQKSMEMDASYIGIISPG